MDSRVFNKNKEKAGRGGDERRKECDTLRDFMLTIV
jgi:hypothetical protein